LTAAGAPLTTQNLSAPGPPGRVVALAASAGGVAALAEILSALPAGFPAPVLVVLHLDPHHRSRMPEVLGRRTALAVAQVRGGERLEAGTIYLAPPDHHLLVAPGGVLALSDAPRVNYVRPAADVLFSSLAEAVGAGAIVAVLTGNGHDGAEGVRAVKRHGGTVIAQDEASSDYSGMPQAAFATGAVDRVLPLAAIAPALVDLTRQGKGTPR
jgi:two-component system, chemotaxis family, protein-glutamate methylesterase/glutaminase